MRIVSAALIGMAAFTAACASNPSAAAPPAAPAPAATPAPAPAPAAPPTAASTTDMSGSWTVSVDIQGQTMAVDITLARGPSGYTGEVTPEGQPAAPLSTLALVGDRLTLTFGAPEGDAVFAGTLSPDRRAASGTVTYRGQSLPFTMTKR